MKTSEGQNIYDIALSKYGSVEGVFLLLKDNPSLGINDILPSEIDIVSSPSEKSIADYFSKKQRSLSTGEPENPAPSALTATATGIGQISLSWQDNSGGAVRFKVFRNGLEIADLNAGTESYIDTELNDSTTYTYTVAASSVGFSYSDEASATTPSFDFELVFVANAATFTFTSSLPQTLYYRLLGGDYELFNHALNGPLTINKTGGATVRFYFTNKALITAFAVDIAAQLRGIMALGNSYTVLRSITAKEGSFSLVVGTWIRNSGVAINVENSIITAERVPELIDEIIIKNGGTTTDNGITYTGTPGESHSGRTLVIGSIELDLGAIENSILYAKIVALQSVGWTISTVTTVCNKFFDVDTLGIAWAAAEIERTRQLVSNEFVSGTPMDLALYDTLANAQAGTATGRLANGYALANAWLLNNTNYNAWALGTKKAVRFYSADNTGVNNRSIVGYKAAPTGDRACGAVTEVFGGFLAGNAKVYDGSDYDTITTFNEFERTQAFTVLAAVNITALTGASQRLFGTHKIDAALGVPRGIGFFLNLQGGTLRPCLQLINSNTNRLDVFANTSVDVGRHVIIITYSGNSAPTGIRIYINGVESATTTLFNALTGTIINPTNKRLSIGDLDITQGIRQWLRGHLRQSEMLNRVATPAEIAAAAATGSFQGAGTVSNADYLLAIDFNKTGAVPPTTRDGTPNYSISSFGGASYTPYL